MNRKAEEALSAPDSATRRQALKEMQHLIQERQKRIRVYGQTVSALEQQYRPWLAEARQRQTQLDTQAADLEHQMARLRQQRIEAEDRLSGFDRQLEQLRAYAAARRDKKSKRERQYNQFYHVPVLAGQYRKKYSRAQAKNAHAEQQVAQLRAEMEDIQHSARSSVTQVKQLADAVEDAKEQQAALADRIDRGERCLAFLRQGLDFWATFDRNQAGPLFDALDGRQPVLMQKLAAEYANREAYAAQHWDRVDVEFTCAKCMQTQVGWPTPDKVRTADLLCAECYQHARTSMIVEKKMNAWTGRLGLGERQSSQQSLERPPSLVSTSSSTASTLLPKKLKGFMRKNSAPLMA